MTDHRRTHTNGYTAADTMVAGHQQQQKQYQHQHRAYGRGGGDHWTNATARPPMRRPYKKYTTFRKLDNGGVHRTSENGPDDKSTKTPSSVSSSSLSSSSSSSSTSSSPSPSSSPHYQAPFRRRTNNDAMVTCETIEWKAMSKHFSKLPPFINDNVRKLKNGYPQTNIPSNHHLQYYSDLHKLHQVAYATKNTASRKPQILLPQPCCKPWQWSPYGGPAGTFMNAYYLSEPDRYADHAINIVQEDSKIDLDEADQLSLSVWRRYTDNRQSVDVYETKMTMWRRLSALIKSRAPGCGLYLVGSTMNGFGGDVSDADFCLLTGCTAAAAAVAANGYTMNNSVGLNSTVNNNVVGDQQQRAAAAAADEQHRLCGVERLQWLMGLLEQEQLDGNVKTVDMRIVYAKVPILRFRWTDDDGDNDHMDVDLCCNNVVGIRNTHLLYCYSRLDYRVRPLVLTIKLWASCHNINDPKKMTLSSYSLVLMVINFLQSVEPPVLPSLQRIYGMKFSVETNIEYVHMHEQLPCSGWRSDNKQSLGELLLQFFNYYNEFNYCKNAVSVRLGRPIQLERCRMADTVKNDPGQWKFIGIEEPFERTNTARSVHNHNIFIQIKEIINKSYNELKKTKLLDSIFCQFEK